MSQRSIDSRHDILIAGGGPVGCALALALRGSGLTVRIAAPASTSRRASGESGASDATSEHERVTRPIALSQASYAYLRRLDVALDRAATPIRTIHVSQRGAFGRTVMSAAEHGLDALGYVFDIDALHGTVAGAAGEHFLDERVLDWIGDDEGVIVRTEPASRETGQSGAAHESRRHAKLLVLADGGALADQAAGQLVHDYGQSAVLGTIVASVPHGHRAWERFTPHGPLALLPYRDRYAFVWALPNAFAQQRMADGDDAFRRALQEAFGDRAGRLNAPGPRSCVPLALKRTRRIDNHAVIAIGNAAQALHPVAGQGLNLGLRDVMALVEMLQANPPAVMTRERSIDLADRFARARWSDRASTIATTDLFVRVFSNDQPLMSAGRGLALGLLDACAPARVFLARRMMLGARALP